MKIGTIAPLSLIALTLALAALVFSLPTAKVQASAANDPATLIKNTRLVNESGGLGEPTSVLIRDGVVRRISKSIEQPDATLIDGTGLTLLPGFVDSHTHSYGSALTDAARFGVTTALDMFTDPRELMTTRQARRELARTQKADLFSAGMLATTARGHGTQFGIPIETLSAPAEAEAWVAARKAEGSDYIKLVYIPDNPRQPSIDRATAKAVIDAGHAEGMLVLAHISTYAAAASMIEDGIDGLVHIFADREVTDALLAEAKAAEVFIIPTLTVIAALDGNNQTLDLDSKNRALLSPMQRQTIDSNFGHEIEGFSLEIALKNVKRFHSAGVPILAGADAPNPGTAHGVSLHHELQLLVRAGLTPYQALQAATATPARLFKLGGRGAITENTRADFLLVEGDPTQDISATLNIKHIFKNGQSISRDATASIATSKISSDLLGDFETDLSSVNAFNWSDSSDAMAGGSSKAILSRVSRSADKGEQEIGHALQIEADVKPGFAFPWAGATVGLEPSGPIEAVSLSAYNALSLDIKGTPGTFRVMAFSAGAAGIPPTQTVEVSESWQTHTLKLTDFAGLQIDQFVGFSFVAGPAFGQSTIYLDNVKLAQ